MQIITLASGNLHKVEEINLIAKDYNIQFVLPKGKFNPIEDGKTFLDNAYAKALCASKQGGTDYYLADDSGLCIDALKGAPGIYSARYDTTPKKRIAKVLANLEGIANRNAKFVCAMVLVNKKGEAAYQTQKECTGIILDKEKGTNGFGYDPIFYLEKYNKTMAELTDIEKSKVSHRSKALNDILNWIKHNLN